MLKRCNKCSLEKASTEFRRDKTDPTGYTATCKECRRLYDKANWSKYKDKAVERNKARWQRTKEHITRYKLQRGCLMCDEDDVVCLEFHHLDPTQKDFEISNQSCRSWESILPEIEKCVVLCSNCHRKFHAGRFTLP